MMPNLVVLLCLLSCVSGGIMIEKLLPSSMLNGTSHAPLRKFESAISIMNSVILEHVHDILGEITGNLDFQETSGKWVGLLPIVYCKRLDRVDKQYRSCQEKCKKLYFFQRMRCISSDFVSYLSACFTGNMYCFSDTLVSVGTCSSNCNCGTVNDQQLKIYGGEDVEYAVNYPWHVGIINTFPFPGKIAYCGGTIIGDRYVITAAHCINPKHIFALYVRIGDHIQTSKDDDIKNVTKNIFVYKVYFHPKNDMKTFANDIALIELTKSITFKNDFGIRPICLPCTNDYEDYAGKSAITLGWGESNKDPIEIPATLKQAEVTILDKDCHGKTGDNFNPDMHMCSKSTFKKGFPCTSDAGGSLFVNEGNKTHKRYVLVGITLSSTCDENNPVIYTRVRSALNWIQSLSLTTTCLTKV